MSPLSLGRRALAPIVLGALIAGMFSATALATHPRVGGAAPLRISLVPAHNQCVASNSSHVSPWALQSCTPPTLESGLLTTSSVGAGSGFTRLDVVCTDAQSPPCTTLPGDQEDIEITGSISDVRCAIAVAPDCTSVGADYTGKLLGLTTLRMTDHSNGNPATVCANGSGSSPCVTATVQDFTLRWIMQCGDNGAANGANCNVSTSLDSMVAGWVKEFQRTTFDFVEPLVYNDAGPDGTLGNCPPSCGSGDETTFMRQGLFAP